ncbi:hypothetical protein B0H19DRAFT_108274 [Mycena capillaripes]|nr:hypothetical protein B0H19DRAFT_108274 [Mycena capillaripes]
MTPYENLFWHGCMASHAELPFDVSVDWETMTPGMSLLSDIHDHYTFTQYAVQFRCISPIYTVPTSLIAPGENTPPVHCQLSRTAHCNRGIQVGFMIC